MLLHLKEQIVSYLACLNFIRRLRFSKRSEKNPPTAGIQ
jgi:hypothetical protein